MRILNCYLHVLFFVFGCCHSGEDSFIASDGMTFGQRIGEDLTGEKVFLLNLTQNQVKKDSTLDGRKYGVYDELLSAKMIVLTRSMLTMDVNGWLFKNYDPDSQNRHQAHDNTPWINELDPVMFASTELCKHLILAIRHLANESNDVDFYPYRSFGKIIRRGDHTRVAADSDVAGEYSALVFLNEYWKKNFYGELYLYDNQKEIFGGATHRTGRVVIWESTVYKLNRPPAVAFLQGQLLLHVIFSKDPAKMDFGHERWLTAKKERDVACTRWHVPGYQLSNSEEFVPDDPARHLKFEFTSRQGRKVLVYDDMFPKDLLDGLREFVLKHGTYYYDDSIDDESDNVQWIARFDLEQYLLSPYWKVVQKIAQHATGSAYFFPYEILVNLIRSADHTKIHIDTAYDGEMEYTCLVYLNPDWDKGNYGETTFFESIDDDTEIMAQVRARYGRVVIFDGNIPHSARPPSFNFSGARLTFATKLSKDEFAGRRKYLSDELRPFSSLLSQLGALKGLKGPHGEDLARESIRDARENAERIYFHQDPELEDPSDESELDGDKADVGEADGKEENGEGADPRSPPSTNDEEKENDDVREGNSEAEAAGDEPVEGRRVDGPGRDRYGSGHDMDPLREWENEPLKAREVRRAGREVSRDDPDANARLRDIYSGMRRDWAKILKYLWKNVPTLM